MTCTASPLTDNGGEFDPGNGLATCTSPATAAISAGDRLYVQLDFPILATAPGQEMYGDVSFRWGFELA